MQSGAAGSNFCPWFADDSENSCSVSVTRSFPVNFPRG